MITNITMLFMNQTVFECDEYGIIDKMTNLGYLR